MKKIKDLKKLEKGELIIEEVKKNKEIYLSKFLAVLDNELYEVEWYKLDEDENIIDMGIDKTQKKSMIFIS